MAKGNSNNVDQIQNAGTQQVEEMGTQSKSFLKTMKEGFSDYWKQTKKELEKNLDSNSELNQSANKTIQAFENLPAALVEKFIPQINSNLQATELNLKGELTDKGAKPREDDRESDKPPEYALDTSIADPSNLNGLSSIEEINVNGYSLLYNALGSTTNSILGKMSEMLQVMTDVNSPVNSAASVQKESLLKNDKEDTDNGKTNQSVKAFLQETAGPINSIAGAVAHIALAIGVLALIPAITGFGGIAAIAGVATVLIGTFAALKFISTRWKDEGMDEIANPENKDQKSSLYYIIDSISNLVLKLSISVALMAVMVKILDPTAIVIGLLSTLGSLVMAVGGAWALSKLIPQEALSKESDSGSLIAVIDSISNVILKISLSAIILGLIPLNVLIKGGLAVVVAEALAIGMFKAITTISNTSSKQNPKQIEQVSDLIKSIGNTILIIGLTAIVLGLIPQNVFLSGLFNVLLVEALAIGLLFAVNKIITESNKQNPKQIEQVTNLIKAITSTIAVLSICVIILGLMPTGVILQGMLTVTLMFTLVIVATKLLEKIQIKPQVFLTLAMVSVFVVAIAALSLLLAVMMPSDLSTRAMLASIAVVMVTGAIVVVALASNLLAPLGMPAMAALIPFKLLALAFTAAILYPIALIALSLAAMFGNPQMAQTAILAATAVMLTTSAIVLIGFSTIALAGIALGLIVATGLAITAINLTTHMVEKTYDSMVTIASTGEKLANLGVTNATEALKTALSGLVMIGIVVTANAVFLAMAAISIVTATASLFIIDTFLPLFSLLLWRAMKDLYLLTLIKVDGVESSITSTSKALSSLSTLDKSLDALNKINLLTIWGASIRIKALKSVYEGLAELGTDGNTKGISALATALERLAQTSPQLRELADSMKGVAEAAQNLNNLDINTKMSVSSMTGGTLGGDLSKLDNVKESLKPSKEKEERVDYTQSISAAAEKIINAINNLAPDLSKMSAATAKQASVMQHIK